MNRKKIHATLHRQNKYLLIVQKFDAFYEFSMNIHNIEQNFHMNFQNFHETAYYFIFCASKRIKQGFDVGDVCEKIIIIVKIIGRYFGQLSYCFLSIIHYFSTFHKFQCHKLQPYLKLIALLKINQLQYIHLGVKDDL